MTSLSVRTRFEVFKRDRFTCRYCGQHAPDVLVEVDHIVPRAAGGSDDMDNLITACWDCNRGKADRLLEEGSRPTVRPDVLEDMEERLAQSQAYAELIGAERRLMDRLVAEIIEAWAHAFRAELEEREDRTYWRLQDHERWPQEASIRLFLTRLPPSDVFNAVDEAAARCGESTDWACRYFYAICWNRIKNPRA